MHRLLRRKRCIWLIIALPAREDVNLAPFRGEEECEVREKLAGGGIVRAEIAISKNNFHDFHEGLLSNAAIFPSIVGTSLAKCASRVKRC